jgi:subtilisin family serine protease
MAVLALALAAASHAGPADAAALDPRLVPILSGARGPDLIGRAVIGIAPSTPAEATVAVSLRINGSIPDLSPLGARIGAVLGDVVTAEVPVSQLPALAAHPSVRSITASRPLTSFLNASVPATKAAEVLSPVWSLANRVPPIEWSGHTGRGVLIGIIDTGLDTTHRDFLRPDGATRVLAAWDQSSAVGHPPLGFSYGAECRAAQIDARQCPLVDRVGHGTHVAGIAAGNGSATGKDRPAYQYIGMAPEADLVVVKLGEQTSNRVIDALAYLKATARAMGRPIVVNISLGTSSGAHDGTSDFERAIDVFTGPGDSPAAVVVVAGGNHGADDSHASGTVGAAPYTVGFIVPTGTTRIELDLWYRGAAQLGVAVTTPSCGATPEASPGGTPVVTVSRPPCGDITISAGETDPDNGDRETVVVLTSATGLAVGAWSLTLTGEVLPPSGSATFDAWSVADEGSPVAKFVIPALGKTLAVPSTATEAITVVHWVTKTRWTSVVGDRAFGATEVIGELATTASRGPRRTCSLPTACPPVPKPDLAAPGTVIMSSLSSRTDEALYETATSTIDDATDLDRAHFIQQGSSMAAPHVAGAAALVLQINPALTAKDVKDLLNASAQPPAVLAPNQWGAGILDVKEATNPLRLADPQPNAPGGLTVVSVGSGRVILRWDPNPDLDLRGYRVYRRAESELVLTLLTAIPIDKTTYEDTEGLANETPYLYRVTAVDIGPPSAPLGERESPLSSRVRAMPTAGEGSVGLCFIATAAYGTPWHPHVQSLRAFRDAHLRPSRLGRAFVAAYERISPPLARVIARHDALRAAARAGLTPVVLAVEHPRATGRLAWLLLLGACIVAVLRGKTS